MTHNPAMPSITGASHMALTVRDLDASAAWYQRVFGWTVLRRFSAEEAGSPRVLLLDPETFFVVGLCQPEDGAGGHFDHRTTGLDHFAFGVKDDDELARVRPSRGGRGLTVTRPGGTRAGEVRLLRRPGRHPVRAVAKRPRVALRQRRTGGRRRHPDPARCRRSRPAAHRWRPSRPGLRGRSIAAAPSLPARPERTPR